MTDPDTDQPVDPTAPPPAEEPAGRPEPSSGRPPALTPDQLYGSAKPRLKDLDAEIERELEEAMGGMTGEQLLSEPARRREPVAPDQQGRKKGRVISIHGADVFVDVPGGRSQGVLPLLQFPDGPPAPGTEVEVHIEGYDHANGLLLLSRKGAAVQADWSTVAPNMTVEARVTAVNKGGLAVDVNGIRGFMPISQIDLYRVENAEQYVNQKLLCLVTEVNPEERNLVVSRRALLEREREEARTKLWAELAEGQVRTGVVRSLKEFGAFVDLGGVDGLLHVSEMSWSRVQDPGAVVQPGQTVKVVVLKIDHERRKVSLGLKQLTASPWDSVQERYHAGTVVKGKVTRLMDFGAFVTILPGRDGLVHISQISNERVERVSDKLKEGDVIRVKVLEVDRQGRIRLSMRNVDAA